jgi:hypothetical protein
MSALISGCVAQETTQARHSSSPRCMSGEVGNDSQPRMVPPPPCAVVPPTSCGEAASSSGMPGPPPRVFVPPTSLGKQPAAVECLFITCRRHRCLPLLRLLCPGCDLEKGLELRMAVTVAGVVLFRLHHPLPQPGVPPVRSLPGLLLRQIKIVMSWLTFLVLGIAHSWQSRGLRLGRC